MKASDQPWSEAIGFCTGCLIMSFGLFLLGNRLTINVFGWSYLHALLTVISLYWVGIWLKKHLI